MFVMQLNSSLELVLYQDGNVGNGCGNAGNRGGNTGNQGGNAGNQSDSLWEFLCLLLRLKPRCVRGAFHHPAFIVSCPTSSHTYFFLIYQVDDFSFKEMRTFLCFFGSNVGILNIIMLIQTLFYQNCKQHVHSRLAIHSKIYCSAIFWCVKLIK